MYKVVQRNIKAAASLRHLTTRAHAAPVLHSRLVAASSSFDINMSKRFMCATPSDEGKHYEFQAETRKLLDIVTHSIYTDKEVFLRELISNASDALEKYKYNLTKGNISADMVTDDPLEITITVDKDAKTLTIQDNGVGMSKEDLISNLGTIARSGSKQFVEQLSSAGSTRDGDGIIGQFGVGFYSGFMVSDKVTVESASGVTATKEDHCHAWASDGSGSYTVAKTQQAVRGTKIVLQLKEDQVATYTDVNKVKDIIKKYSNFVSFPIRLNGELVNTVSAIWAQDPKSVTEDEYKSFYKYIASAFDEPKYRLHFRTDAPIDIRALLYFPSMHTEKFGMGRMEPGVNLYSRKVLIENKPKDLLPEWLRFVKGAVDSEDLPLSITREKSQDSRLLGRIKDVLTRKVIRFLEEKASSDSKEFMEFYKEFHFFLKEGICQDVKYQEQLSKLLRYESSTMKEGEMTSLDEYVSRCPPEQKDIYFIVAPSRSSAFQSPYYETFKKHNREVLFLYHTIDDFTMTNLKTFNGRNLLSAETSSINLDGDDDKKEGEEKEKLSAESGKELCDWFKTVLGKKVKAVTITERLHDSPCIITDHESGAVRRMMKMIDQGGIGSSPGAMPPQTLQINPSHPVMINLANACSENPQMAELVAHQLMDNALVAAGLMDDARTMIPRMNDILARALSQKSDGPVVVEPVVEEK